MRTVHQATHRRGHQKKIQTTVTQKTWKQREKANRIVGLLLHVDEGSLHRVFRRCRQTNQRKRCPSLIACPYHQTHRPSASAISQRTCFGASVFDTASCSPSLLLWFVKPKPLIKHQIKGTHIRKAFFIAAFEQSWHFTYIPNTDQLKGFTGQICSPQAIRIRYGFFTKSISRDRMDCRYLNSKTN